MSKTAEIPQRELSKTVLVTPTSPKYHYSSGCMGPAQQDAISVKLKTAVKVGKEACGICVENHQTIDGGPDT